VSEQFSRTAWIVTGLVVITLGTFADVRTFDFVSYDDPWYITSNPHVTAGLSWQGLWWALTSGYLFYWHPLTWLTHMTDVQLFGLNAGGHHTTNLLLHIAGTLVLFFTLRRATGAEGPSALVAALFAVHPLHVESVAWVSERKDVLSGLLFMLTLWAYVRYANRQTTARYLLVALFLSLGLMAKPMLVTLPVVLLLFDVWPLRRLALAGLASRGKAFSLLREKIPLFVLAGLAGLATLAVQAQVGAVGTLTQLPLTYRVSNALLSYVNYAVQMVWPTGLAVFYPYPPALPPWWHVAAAAIALVIATLVTVRARVRRPYLLAGWLWYLVTLLPVIGLFQAGDQLMADRFTYIPLIGLFVMFAWSGADAAARWPRLRPALTVASLLVVGACAFGARQQTQFWANSETLWRRALSVTTGNHRAHAALGEVFERQGLVDEAIAEYRTALRIVPDQAEWRNNLGVLYTRQDKVAEAMGQFAIATRLKPDFADAHNNLGAMHARAGQPEEAIASYTRALTLAPDNALAHGNLALVLAGEGQLERALRECREAIRLDPANDDWKRLAASLSERIGK
jgi:Tfp pilus assembly protein PilF